MGPTLPLIFAYLVGPVGDYSRAFLQSPIFYPLEVVLQNAQVCLREVEVSGTNLGKEGEAPKCLQSYQS